MVLEMALPEHEGKRLPAFLVPAGSSQFQKQVAGRGYALVNFDIKSIEADATNGYPESVRAFYAAPGQTRVGADEWGAIGAWAWGASRALDYLLTDPDIDPAKICIQGLSRWGKVAMWAGAQDQRFAIVFSCESGCGGAVLVRRQYGETVKAITTRFPHWFDANFATFGDRVNDLPVDWHMLIALMAPRPVYISTAVEDRWGDPRGAFLAAKAAEPVYRLFGKNGLGVDEMPGIESPVGETIGFHERRGKHAINEYDWDQFLNFADRHFGTPGQ